MYAFLVIKAKSWKGQILRTEQIQILSSNVISTVKKNPKKLKDDKVSPFLGYILEIYITTFFGLLIVCCLSPFREYFTRNKRQRYCQSIKDCIIKAYVRRQVPLVGNGKDFYRATNFSAKQVLLKDCPISLLLLKYKGYNIHYIRFWISNYIP